MGKQVAAGSIKKMSSLKMNDALIFNPFHPGTRTDQIWPMVLIDTLELEQHAWKREVGGSDSC